MKKYDVNKKNTLKAIGLESVDNQPLLGIELQSHPSWGYTGNIDKITAVSRVSRLFYFLMKEFFVIYNL